MKSNLIVKFIHAFMRVFISIQLLIKVVRGVSILGSEY